MDHRFLTVNYFWCVEQSSSTLDFRGLGANALRSDQHISGGYRGQHRQGKIV